MKKTLPKTVPAKSTRDEIMDVAERLFGEHGFDGTSLRQLTKAADVNLAAVNYHFRSKEGLLDAIFERRLVPMNRERIDLLDRALSATPPGGRPELEAIIHALVWPPLRLWRQEDSGGHHFIKLIGRIHQDPRSEVKQMFHRYFDTIEKRFVEAMQRACPELPQSELIWCGVFTVGGMVRTLCIADELCPRFGDLNLSDVEGIARRLVTFSAAGFRAAVARQAPQPVLASA